MRLGTKPISWKQLTGSENKYFWTSVKNETPRDRRLSIRLGSVVSGWRRYPLHNSFLKQNSGWVRVFADIGCGIGAGAPTTIEARGLLPGAKIIATDVIRPSKAVSKILERNAVEFQRLEIAKRPLKEKCDVIRFANVAQWLIEAERDSALHNVWLSLKPGGLLLGAAQREGGIDVEFILRKTEQGWERLIVH
jgi:SAM-dependent methyltransferase